MAFPVRPIVLALTALVGAACTAPSTGADSVRDMPPREAWTLMQAGDVFVVDVRTPAEVAGGVIPGVDAIADWNAGPEALQQAVASVSREATVLIYCRSGNRSGAAADFLRRQGFTRMVNVIGGITAWADQGLPLSRL